MYIKNSSYLAYYVPHSNPIQLKSILIINNRAMERIKGICNIKI